MNPLPTVKPQERRQHERYKSYSIIKVISPSGTEIQHDQPALVNISEGGMLFYSVENISQRTRIRIRIDIAEFNSSIAVLAEVIWVQKAVDRTECYFVGARFVDIDEGDKGLIRRMAATGKKADY